MFLLFFVGVLEMIVITAWTKVVSDTKVILSGLITVVNIFIWYYVLRIFVENIENWVLLVVYVSGCAVGTMITTYYFKKKALKEKVATHK